MKTLFSCIVLTTFCFFAHGQIITTVVSHGGALGDGGPASAASVNYAVGICFDKHDNIYIADNRDNRIRRIDAVTGIITTVVGTGTPGHAGDGGPATAAQLGEPVFIAMDTSDNLYIGDTTYRIRKVNALTGIISTYAGTGINASTGNGGAATAADIYGGGIAFDNFGSLYLTDVYSVRKINSSGIISSVAGNGISGTPLNNVPATSTPLSYTATGIAFDIDNNLYFDDGTCSIRKVNYSTGIITKIAGLGDTSCYPYSGDGNQATASKMSSFGLVVDFFGNIFFNDASNNRLVKIDTFGVLHTIAGNGTGSFSGDGGPATAATVNYGEFVTLDHCGNIYFSDFGNDRIRKIMMPANPGIKLYGPTASPVASTVTITAKVGNAGTNYAIKWMNHGVVFATTSSPTVTYTKAAGIDTITAKVYGCSDSAISAIHIVAVGPNSVSGLLSNEPEIQIYPNPSQGTFEINGENITSMRMWNSMGDLVRETELNPGKNMVTIEDLPSGMYILEITNKEGKRAMNKLIKE